MSAGLLVLIAPDVPVVRLAEALVEVEQRKARELAA